MGASKDQVRTDIGEVWDKDQVRYENLADINADNLITGTVPDARIAESSVTQHEGALSISGPQVDSGTLPDARIQESGVTQHGIAALEVPWSNTVVVEGDSSTRTTRATAVQSAITEAAGASKSFVFVPHDYLDYDASAVTFDNSVRMLREGQVADVYDVKAYGAAGDGAVDDSAAVQAAIDAAEAAGGGTVDFGRGDFNIGGTSLLVRKTIHLMGDGFRSVGVSPTVLTYSGTGVALDVAPSAGGDLYGLRLSGFEVRAEGSAVTSATAKGIRCTSVLHSLCEHIAVTEFQSGEAWLWTGATNHPSVTNTIINPFISACLIGIKASTVGGAAATHGMIYGGVVGGSGLSDPNQVGVDLDSESWRIRDLDVTGIVGAGATGIVCRANADNTGIHGVRFEGNFNDLNILAGAVDVRYSDLTHISTANAKVGDSGTRTRHNGYGAESANAETPTITDWEYGNVVDFTDTGDGSGTGLYILNPDNSWSQLA